MHDKRRSNRGATEGIFYALSKWKVTEKCMREKEWEEESVIKRIILIDRIGFSILKKEHLGHCHQAYQNIVFKAPLICGVSVTGLSWSETDTQALQRLECRVLWAFTIPRGQSPWCASLWYLWTPIELWDSREINGTSVRVGKICRKNFWGLGDFSWFAEISSKDTVWDRYYMNGHTRKQKSLW